MEATRFEHMFGIDNGCLMWYQGNPKALEDMPDEVMARWEVDVFVIGYFWGGRRGICWLNLGNKQEGHKNNLCVCGEFENKNAADTRRGPSSFWGGCAWSWGNVSSVNWR